MRLLECDSLMREEKRKKEPYVVIYSANALLQAFSAISNYYGRRSWDSRFAQ